MPFTEVKPLLSTSWIWLVMEAEILWDKLFSHYFDVTEIRKCWKSCKKTCSRKFFLAPFPENWRSDKHSDLQAYQNWSRQGRTWSFQVLSNSHWEWRSFSISQEVFFTLQDQAPNEVWLFIRNNSVNFSTLPSVLKIVFLIDGCVLIGVLFNTERQLEEKSPSYLKSRNESLSWLQWYFWFCNEFGTLSSVYPQNRYMNSSSVNFSTWTPNVPWSFSRCTTYRNSSASMHSQISDVCAFPTDNGASFVLVFFVMWTLIY